MELKIVNFIKTHSNWEELLTSSPYNLSVKRDGKLILFKYNQINSDFNEEICCEARGLILEEGTWKVVRMAFKKFFNIGESFAAQIDWSSAWASEKIDGSIISVFYYDNKWRIATNSTIDAFKAEINNSASPYKTYGELFETICPLSNFEHFSKNKCWTFELVSPFTRIVLDYPEPALYLLSIRNMENLEELSSEAVEILGEANGFKVPKRYYFYNKEYYCELVENMDDDNEGIVVCDDNFNRVKIKTKKYIELHRMANNGILTTERALSIFLENEMSEFLTYFPQYKDFIYNVIDKYDVACREIIGVNINVEEWKNKHPLATRKDFSDWVKEHFSSYAKWAYLAYDGRLSIEGKTAKELVKFLGLD